MPIRLSALFSFALAAVLTAAAEQEPPVRPARTLRPAAAVHKQRTHDVPTPAQLGGLLSEPVRQDLPDGGAVPLALPDVWAVDPATGVEYRKGEVLLRFHDSVPANLRTQAVERMGGRRLARVLANWNVVELQPGASAIEVARSLRGLPEVAEVSLNYRLRTQQFRPNDEFHHLQWNFQAINLPVAWEINPGARSDVVVAVIDTGLNILTDTFVFASPIVGQIPVRFAAVPDLVTDERIVSPYDFVYDDAFPVDLGGHGTHVAGTIAQQTNNNIGVAGIAYNVRLMPLKVISGGSLTSWDDVFFPGNRSGSVAIIAEAIRYAADNGARVINLSLGGPGPAPSIRDAIRYAVSRGAFVAIAAGNSGDEGNPTLYPAAYATEINGAMAVGAINRGLRRAAYSSFHPYVEICAPGGEVTSLIDYERGVSQIGYTDEFTLPFSSLAQKRQELLRGFRPRFDQFALIPLNGTSMAAPHVAGVAALLYSQGINSPSAIEDAIERFATPIDARADECGAGLVDARRALRGLGLTR